MLTPMHSAKGVSQHNVQTLITLDFDNAISSQGFRWKKANQVSTSTNGHSFHVEILNSVFYSSAIYFGTSFYEHIEQWNKSIYRSK